MRKKDVASTGQGREHVGIVCMNCLIVFTALPKRKARCPKCNKLDVSPTQDEVLRSSGKEPPPEELYDVRHGTNQSEWGAPPSRPVRPSPFDGPLLTSKGCTNAFLIGLGTLVVVIAAVAFSKVLFPYNPDNERRRQQQEDRERERYQPHYPEYQNHPGLSPVDRERDWSRDEKAKVKDALVEFNKAQGKIR